MVASLHNGVEERKGCTDPDIQVAGLQDLVQFRALVAQESPNPRNGAEDQRGQHHHHRGFLGGL
ncbi:MAG: hypothetical protein K8R38_02460, partial [Verrucomicrobia bacterium]|nr:hypothetical protein [Verrucomicrobiota bacterium]